MALEGPRYRTAIQAVSDEMLLDQLLMPPSAGTAGENAGALLASLVTHTGVDGALDAGTFAEHSGEQLCSRPGRELEQERRTGGRDGAGCVSRGERRADAFVCADHGPSA